MSAEPGALCPQGRHGEQRPHGVAAGSQQTAREPRADECGAARSSQESARSSGGRGPQAEDETEDRRGRAAAAVPDLWFVLRLLRLTETSAQERAAVAAAEREARMAYGAQLHAPERAPGGTLLAAECGARAALQAAEGLEQREAAARERCAQGQLAAAERLGEMLPPRCPQRHCMQVAVAWLEGLMCRVCGRDIPAGAPVMYCTECEYPYCCFPGAAATAQWLERHGVLSAVDAALGAILAERPAEPVARLAELVAQGHSGGTQRTARRPADAVEYLRDNRIPEHLDAAVAAVVAHRPSSPVATLAVRLAATAYLPPVPWSGLGAASAGPPGSPQSPGPASPRRWAREGLAQEQEQRARHLPPLVTRLPSHPVETPSASSLAGWVRLAAAGDNGALAAVAQYLSLPPADIPAERMGPQLGTDICAPRVRDTALQCLLRGLGEHDVAEADRLLQNAVARATKEQSAAAWLADARRAFLQRERADSEEGVRRDALLNERVVRAGGIDIVLTDTMKDAAEQIADALELQAPVLLEGPTGSGKTMLSRLAICILNARRTAARSGGPIPYQLHAPREGGPAEQRMERFNLSDSVEPEDLLFRWAADPDKGGVVTCPQPFAEAAKVGNVILLDEMNLAREAVLKVIEAVIDHRKIAFNDPSSWGVSLSELRVHENFRIIATQNPAGAAGYEGHRVALSPPFLSRFRRVPLPPTERDDLIKLVSDRLLRSSGILPLLNPLSPVDADALHTESLAGRLAAALVDGHLAVARRPRNHAVLDCVTVRDLLRWAESLPPISGRDFDSTAVAEVGWLCYCARYTEGAARQECCDALMAPLKGAFPGKHFSALPLVQEDTDTKEVGRSREGDYLLEGPFALLRKRLQRALKMDRPLLLLGPPGSGKTRAVEELCKAEGRALQLCVLTATTEAATLVGQYLPSSGGDVAWVSGCVSTAYEQGATLLLDNIDAAPATVCERLNPVTECPPEWCTPERNRCSAPVRGAGFRVIAICSDPGRLSPAFVNRFLVIAHCEVPTAVLAAVGGLSAAELGELGGSGLRQAVRLREAKRLLGPAEVAHWALGGTGPIPSDVAPIAAAVWAAQERRVAALAATGSPPMSELEGKHPFADEVRRGGVLLSLGLPVLLRGGAGWGASSLAADVARQRSGKDPVVYIATSQTTVADLVGCPTLAGKCAPGPLLRAWRSGRVLVIEGADRLPGGVLGEIAPALQNLKNTGALCDKIALQVGQMDTSTTTAMDDFGIIGLVHSKGALAACQELFVEISLPDPATAWRRAGRHSGPTIYHILARSCGLSERAAQAAAYLPQMTPRVFACVARRAQALRMLQKGEDSKRHPAHPRTEAERDAHWANCCASWLLPALPPVDSGREFGDAIGRVWKDCKVDKSPPRIMQVEDTVCFAQWGLYCELQGSLEPAVSAMGAADETLDGPDEGMPEAPVGEQPMTVSKLQKGRRLVALALKSALCSIAFAYSAKQTIALAGPPSFKSFAVSLFNSILLGSTAVRVQISPTTTSQDLLGSICPCAVQGERGSLRVAPDAEASSSLRDGCSAAPKELILDFQPAVVTAEAERVRQAPCFIIFEGAECASEDLFGELGVLLRERHLLLEVGGMGERNIRVQEETAFCLVACPPASAVCALGGIAAHWCRAYGPDEQNSILAHLVHDTVARLAPPTAGPPDGSTSSAAETEAQAVAELAARFDHCPLRERLRLAELVCSLAAECASRGVQIERERWSDCIQEIGSLFGPQSTDPGTSVADDGTGRRDSLPGFQSIDFGSTHIGIGPFVRVRRVAMSEEERRNRENALKCRVHIGARTFATNLARVCLAAQHRFPVSLQGLPGTGKTLVAEEGARMLGHDFLRVQLSQGTTEADVYGSLMPARGGETDWLDEQRSGGASASTDAPARRPSLPTLEDVPLGYQWADGAITGAIRALTERKQKQRDSDKAAQLDQQLWLCLDEFNLAPHAVIQCLLPLLNGDKELCITQTGERLCIKDVVVIATFNSAATGGGREPLPHSISCCLLPVVVEPMRLSEIRSILSGGHVDPHGYRSMHADNELDNVWIDRLMHVHEYASAVIEELRLPYHYAVNLRALEAVVQCFGPLVRRLQRGQDSEPDLRFIDCLHAVYCAPHPPGPAHDRIHMCVKGVADHLKVNGWQPGSERQRVALPPRGFARPCRLQHGAMTEEHAEALNFLATVQPSGRAVLLHGPPASGKTAVLREFARRCRRELIVIPAHLFTDEGDLVGQVCVSGMDGEGVDFACGLVARQAQRVAAAAALHAPPGSARGADMLRFCEQFSLSAGVDDTVATLGALAAEALNRHQPHTAESATSGESVPGHVLLARYAQLLITLQAHGHELRQTAATTRQQCVSFHFVESALVHALYTGKWVLIEGINRAPPGVIERLNPLFEARRSLDLLSRQAVDRMMTHPLTPEDGIHPDFRLFATASAGRTEVSSSLCNRMICMHLTAPSAKSLAELLCLAPADQQSGSDAVQQLIGQRTIHDSEGESADDTAARYAARLRVLLHGIQMWQHGAQSQGDFRSLVFHLLSAMTSDRHDAQSAADAAADLQAYLRALSSTGGGVSEVSEAGHALGELESALREDGQVGREHAAEGESDAAGRFEQMNDHERAIARRAGHKARIEDEQAGAQDWATVEALLDRAWTLKEYAAGTRCPDVIVTTEKAELLAKRLTQLWRVQPGTVLAEMLRCIRSSDPSGTAMYVRDKAVQLQEAFPRTDIGRAELFLLWWYSTEGPDVDRVCGFEVSPPKWEWVRATCGEVRQIRTRRKSMKVALFKCREHAEITDCPEAHHEYKGRWLGPIIVSGEFLTPDELRQRAHITDAEPATFTVRHCKWQEYAEQNELHSADPAQHCKPVHDEQEYTKKWGNTRNFGISYAMCGAMLEAARSAEGITIAGSLIKSISLIAHLGWPEQGEARQPGAGRRRLYRGISQLPADVAEKYSALREEETIVLINPSSTSVDAKAAIGFIKGKKECAFFFDIDAPDYAGIQMHVSQYPREAEILLPPFTKLRIVRVIPAGTMETAESGVIPQGVLEKATYVHARLVGCGLFDTQGSGFRNDIAADAAEANRQLCRDEVSLRELTIGSMLGQAVLLRKLYARADAGGLVAQQSLGVLSATEVDPHNGSPAGRTVTVTLVQLPSDCVIEPDPTARKRFRDMLPESAPTAGGPEWDKEITLSCYDAGIVQEIATVLATLFPSAALQQRGPPAARGSRLHIRALVRAIASRFTYRRIYVGRAQSGGRPQTAVMVLVDIAPGASQLVLLSAVQRALCCLDIHPGVAVHAGNEVWCISPPGQQWTRSAGAALLGLFAARSLLVAPLQDSSPAIHFAASVLAAAPAPARRLLWLTQGDGGSLQRHGSRRSAVLAGAQAADMEVTAICLKSADAAEVSGNVHISAHRAVSINSVAHLPRALRRLATGDIDPLDDMLRTTSAELGDTAADSRRVEDAPAEGAGSPATRSGISKLRPTFPGPWAFYAGCAGSGADTLRAPPLQDARPLWPPGGAPPRQWGSEGGAVGALHQLRAALEALCDAPDAPLTLAAARQQSAQQQPDGTAGAADEHSGAEGPTMLEWLFTLPAQWDAAAFPDDFGNFQTWRYTQQAYLEDGGCHYYPCDIVCPDPRHLTRTGGTRICCIVHVCSCMLHRIVAGVDADFEPDRWKAHARWVQRGRKEGKRPQPPAVPLAALSRIGPHAAAEGTLAVAFYTSHLQLPNDLTQAQVLQLADGGGELGWELNGLLIKSVQAGGRAAAAGLTAKCIILSVGGIPVASESDVNAALVAGANTIEIVPVPSRPRAHQLHGGLNWAMRERPIAEGEHATHLDTVLAIFRPWLRRLDMFIRDMDTEPALLFRGMTRVRTGRHYRLGTEITYHAFTTSSTNAKVTWKFAGADGGTWNMILAVAALPIFWASQYPAERELLLRPNCTVRVMDKIADSILAVLLTTNDTVTLAQEVRDPESALSPKAAVGLRLHSMQSRAVVLRELISRYVEPRVRWARGWGAAAAGEADRDELLFAAFDRWLAGPSQWLLIVAPAGEGKSSALLRLHALLLEAAAGDTVPFFASLSLVRDPTQRPDWLIRQLRLQMAMGDAELAYLLQGDAIYFCDSADECGAPAAALKERSLAARAGIPPKHKGVISVREEDMEHRGYEAADLVGPDGAVLRLLEFGEAERQRLCAQLGQVAAYRAAELLKDRSLQTAEQRVAALAELPGRLPGDGLLMALQEAARRADIEHIVELSGRFAEEAAQRTLAAVAASLSPREARSAMMFAMAAEVAQQLPEGSDSGAVIEAWLQRRMGRLATRVEPSAWETLGPVGQSVSARVAALMRLAEALAAALTLQRQWSTRVGAAVEAAAELCEPLAEGAGAPAAPALLQLLPGVPLRTPDAEDPESRCALPHRRIHEWLAAEWAARAAARGRLGKARDVVTLLGRTGRAAMR